MTDVGRRRLAWLLAGAVFAGGAFYAVASVALLSGERLAAELMWMLLPAVTVPAAMLILRPRPDNPIGWWLMAWALGLVLSGLSNIPIATLDQAPESPGLWTLAAIWFNGFSWVFLIYPIFFLLLLFPTGRLPSSRWRWLPWLAAVSVTFFVVVTALAERFESGFGGWSVANPIGFIGDRFWAEIFPLPWTIQLLVLAFGSATAVFSRFRRGSPDERHQIKWLAYAVGVFIAVYAFLAVASDWELGLAIDVLFVLSIMAIPTAIAVAVLRYRLYDIDLVISRTLVYGALALFITGVYVGIVVGVGSFLGADDAAPLPFVATVLVAVAFQPLRDRFQKIADRVAYGRRATPYEALSNFSRRLSATSDSLLEQVVRSLIDGTSAEQAAVWVRQGDVLVRSRSWPADDVEPQAYPFDVETIPGTDRTAWVTHEGERLGALTLSFPRALNPTPPDERLLTELASGMGLALQNLMLTRSLHDRVAELRESRRRIVAAQDETRRRLERDLHDGAQQQLVALKVKLSLARKMAAGSDSPRAAEVLDGLNAEAETAIQSMRTLARGIYPPLLEAEGLGPAVAALARQSQLPVSVDPEIGRYPGDIESTAYFCIAESIQHIAKHTQARSIHVWLREEAGDLVFTLRHDGSPAKPDPSSNGLVTLADRLDAVTGRLEVDQAPSGTTITGRIPIPAKVIL